MKIGKERFFALFGNPVGHSLSPLMHNAAYRAMNLAARYQAFLVPDSETAMRLFREMGMDGASVTLPFKTSIMTHLDDFDEDCRAIGAVNTVWARGGKLFGANTDWIGLARSLKGHFDLRGKTLAILGSGGASRAAVFAVRKEGGHPVLVCRNPSRGRELARDFDCPSHPLSDLRRVKAHALINTTPVGMGPDAKNTPARKEDLVHFQWVMDVVYNPLHTALLREAEAAGCGVISGLSMFVHQGAEQVRIWTGMEPPVDLMGRVAEEELLRRSAGRGDSRRVESPT
jgi:shikimate dehydrogenase